MSSQSLDGSDVTPRTDSAASSQERKEVVTMVRQYGIPLLVPGAPGSPYFDGTRVTDFLRQYNNMCEDTGLLDVNRVRHLSRYCELATAQYLSTIPEYYQEDWKELQNVLKKEFRDQDPIQTQQILAFLEGLKNNKMKNVKQYCRYFKSTADVLLEKKKISEYQCGLWFLQGLPNHLASKLLRKYEIDIEEPNTIDMAKLYKSTIKYVLEEEQLEGLRRKTWNDEGSIGVEITAPAPAVIPFVSDTVAKAAPMAQVTTANEEKAAPSKADCEAGLVDKTQDTTRRIAQAMRDKTESRLYFWQHWKSGEPGAATISSGQK